MVVSIHKDDNREKENGKLHQYGPSDAQPPPPPNEENFARFVSETSFTSTIFKSSKFV